jgi:hypothetical protein
MIVSPSTIAFSGTMIPCVFYQLNPVRKFLPGFHSNFKHEKSLSLKVNHLTRLDECYERGLLRKVAASKDKAIQSLAQALEWVNEGGYDGDAGSLRSALIAAYRGYFHAARAVLFRDGVREKSHYCIGVNRFLFVSRVYYINCRIISTIRQPRREHTSSNPGDRCVAGTVTGAVARGVTGRETVGAEVTRTKEVRPSSVVAGGTISLSQQDWSISTQVAALHSDWFRQ